MSKDILTLAREAGVISTKIDGIERFAELVRADEREACAKAAEDMNQTVSAIWSINETTGIEK